MVPGELAELVRLLSDVRTGAPTVAVIAGPPGSGRTRLLERFVRHAEQRGLAPVREPGWISLGAARRLAASRTGGTTVLVCDFPDSMDPRIWPVLSGMARDTPTMIVLTWPTGQRPVPVLPTARAHRISLAPLTEAATDELAARMLGARPGPELRSLARVAAGNPATAEDLFAGLREEGLIRVTAGQAELLATRLPARTRVRLAGRLAALHPPTRHLLQVAAMREGPVRVADLVRRRGGTAADLLPLIDEALESGLLRGDGDTLTFSHDLVRSLVQASIPVAVRTAMREEAAPGPAPDEGWLRLTDRERHISWLVGRALTNQQIANRIGRSPHTVNYHLRRIFQQLGIGSRVELAAVAHRHQYLVESTAPADGQAVTATP